MNILGKCHLLCEAFPDALCSWLAQHVAHFSIILIEMYNSGVNAPGALVTECVRSNPALILAVRLGQILKSLYASIF